MRVWFWKHWRFILIMAVILALVGYTAYEQITNPPETDPDGCNAGVKAGDYPPGF